MNKRPDDSVGSQLCGKKGCPICVLHAGLIADRAQATKGPTFVDEDCRWTFRFIDPRQCETRLRLDIKDATYRRTKRRGQMKKMCDFAVVASQDARIRLLAIELKGTAKIRGFQQLQAGLDVLRTRLPISLTIECITAYMVCSKQTEQFMKLARPRLRSLRFGNDTVRFRLAKCGTDLRK